MVIAAILWQRSRQPFSVFNITSSLWRRMLDSRRRERNTFTGKNTGRAVPSGARSFPSYYIFPRTFNFLYASPRGTGKKWSSRVDLQSRGKELSLERLTNHAHLTWSAAHFRKTVARFARRLRIVMPASLLPSWYIAFTLSEWKSCLGAYSRDRTADSQRRPAATAMRAPSKNHASAILVPTNPQSTAR